MCMCEDIAVLYRVNHIKKVAFRNLIQVISAYNPTINALMTTDLRLNCNAKLLQMFDANNDINNI